MREAPRPITTRQAYIAITILFVLLMGSVYLLSELLTHFHDVGVFE